MTSSRKWPTSKLIVMSRYPFLYFFKNGVTVCTNELRKLVELVGESEQNVYASFSSLQVIIDLSKTAVLH